MAYFTSRADLNVGLVNQYILNNRGSIQNFGQTIIDFYDPTFGLPANPSAGDKYVSTATANGWILNNIVVFDGTLGVWKNISPLPGSLVWREVPGDMRLYNAATLAWEIPAGPLGGVISPGLVSDNAVVRFDGSTGSYVQTSGVSIDDFNNITGINNIMVDGNVTVNGTTTSINSEQLNVTDAYIFTGKGYTLPVDRPSGIIFNYLGTGVTTTTVSPGFTAQVTATSDATITVAAAGPLYANGDIIQISGSALNDGVYEVLSHSSNIITIKSTGINLPVSDFVADVMTTEDIAGVTISGVNLMVMRASDGVLEFGTTTDSSITYTGIADINSTVGKQIFTSNTVWVVPANVTHVWVTAQGAGSCGGNASGVNAAAAGGSAGMAIVKYPRKVSPGDNITITIGLGGVPPSNSGGDTVINFNGTFTLTCYGGGAPGNALSNQVSSAGGGGGPKSRGYPGISNHTSLVIAAPGGNGGDSSLVYPLQAEQGADGGSAGTIAFSSDGIEGSSTSQFVITGSSGGGGTFATTSSGKRGANCCGFVGGNPAPATVVAEPKSGSSSASMFGNGMNGVANNGNGLSAPATSYGVGGSGAVANNGGSFTGGIGANGIVIIEYL